MDREASLLKKLKADKRIRFIAPLSGGRVVIEIPLDMIDSHDALKQIRGGSDLDVKLLTASVKATGGDTLYAISLFCESEDDDVLRYYVGDGHQRLKAMLNSGQTKTVAQVVLRWRDDRDAMTDCVSANVVRYAWSDEDICSIIRSGKVPTAKLKEITGFSDSTMDRYTAIAPELWVMPLISTKCLGYSKAAALLKLCENNRQKIEALKNGLTSLFDEAMKTATYYDNEDKKSKLPAKDRKKKDPDYWWKLWSKKVDAVAAAIMDENGIEKVDGQWFPVLNEETISQKSGAIFGHDNEWESRLALSNFFDRDVKDVPISSIELVLDKLPDIEKWLHWHLERLQEAEYRQSNPPPKTGKTASEESEAVPPTVQLPHAEVVSD